jgi:hypothetical protein
MLFTHTKKKGHNSHTDKISLCEHILAKEYNSTPKSVLVFMGWLFATNEVWTCIQPRWVRVEGSMGSVCLDVGRGARGRHKELWEQDGSAACLRAVNIKTREKYSRKSVNVLKVGGEQKKGVWFPKRGDSAIYCYPWHVCGPSPQQRSV